MVSVVRSVVLVAACCVAGAAGAWGFSPDYAYYGAPDARFLTSSHTLQQLGNGTFAAAKKGRTTARVARTASTVRFEPASAPIAPARLAQSYPAGGRAQAQAFFTETLAGWHRIEAKFGLPRNDLAGAVAAFVAGNYIAYHDEPFPDRHFKALVAQMREAIDDADALRRSSNAEKQELYETLAILGTYMALTREALQKAQDPKLAAQVRAAAHDYLRQFLNVDAARLRITASGLSID